jgi:hypothetical protein
VVKNAFNPNSANELGQPYYVIVYDRVRPSTKVDNFSVRPQVQIDSEVQRASWSIDIDVAFPGIKAVET